MFTYLPLFFGVISIFSSHINAEKLLVVSVATERNDPVERFERSLRVNGLEFEIFGIGQKWNGGDLENGLGGGQKINILRKSLLKYAANDNLIIMFTDSYDVIFNDGEDSIMQKYKSLNSRVVFGAENFCWPDKEKANEYPEVQKGEKRFLNSGGFMGPINDMLSILLVKDIPDDYDDQRYYTEIFLNNTLRRKFDITLDRRAQIFMNLHGALDEMNLYFEDGTGIYSNIITKSVPSVYHANGPIKVDFNNMANYLAKSWIPKNGCLQCDENLIDLTKKLPSQYPIVQLSIFISFPTPFLDRFFNRTLHLKYPRNRLQLTIFSPFEIHVEETNNFLQQAESQKIHSIEIINMKNDFAARIKALETCIKNSCDYIFMLDGISQLTDPNVIIKLIEANRSVIAPRLSRRKKLWSNFWGALSKDGYYARSDDYVEIVESVKKGIWNVPYLASAYLIKAKHAENLSRTYKKLLQSDRFNPDNSDLFVCEANRKNKIFMFVDNREDFGYLIDPSTMTTSHLHNDIWQTFDNPLDWEEVYVHSENKIWAAPEKLMEDFEQPCPDVFWFPLMSPKFCKEIIEEMEQFGEWSSGSNKDSRLEGGYENVPTRDIHMRQVQWEDHWIHILRKYVKPIQRKLFQGHEDEPWARMNFIVRYKPDEQPSLRPHHDSSSYTLNMALNRPEIDYQGGGAHFIRYKCTVKDSRVGWTLIHPGRVTHYHEGLKTTNGTRYIFVTFVNP